MCTTGYQMEIIKNSNKRIQPLDGLRAIAVLSVILSHVHMHSGYPPYNVTLGNTTINLMRIVFPFLGRGVDLFFVISGFCMYMTWERRYSSITIQNYKRYIFRRWCQITASIYVCIIISSVFAIFYSHKAVTLSIISKHFIFTHLWPQSNNIISPPFWSIATEWQFYSLLPFLILLLRKFFWTSFWCTILLLLCIRFTIYYSGFGLQPRRVSNLVTFNRIFMGNRYS